MGDGAPAGIDRGRVNMRIGDLMSSQVQTCSPDDTLNRAAQVMWEHDRGSLPVVDAEARVVGMITDRDICMAAFTRGKPLHECHVTDAMSRTVYSCSENDRVGDVEELMQDRQIRRVPVLGEWGQLVGIVTLADLARYAQSKTRRLALGASGLVKTVASVTEPRPAEASHAAE